MSTMVTGLQITVLGMGTVFCILALLYLAMSILHQVLAKMETPGRREPSRTRPPSPVKTQPPSRFDSDLDDELASVLTAAVAAYKKLSRDQSQ